MSKSYQFERKSSPHHDINEAYIKELDLNMDHMSSLFKRGLTREHIYSAQYRSKAQNSAKNSLKILKNMNDKFGSSLEGVPGFFFDEKQNGYSLLGTTGMVIPSRDIDGKVNLLVIRADTFKTNVDGKAIGKYIFFSTGGKNKGGKVKLKTHCPTLTGTARKVSGTTVRITEGVLKADVTTALGDIYCLGMHGLNLQDDLGQILIDLEISEIRICLDSGEDENEDIISAKIKLIELAIKIGIDWKIEIWDPQYGKGIDDVLKSGNADKIHIASHAYIDDLYKKQKKIKPVIMVDGGGLSDQATEGESALINANFNIYQRGKKLVTPITQTVEATGGRQAKIGVLHEISRTRMVDLLCQSASWLKADERGNLFNINPPMNVADTILNRFGEWGFPSLSGVLMTQTLRPDGSLLKDKGYDPTTRLYLLDAPEIPDIPETPSREDALKSLSKLEGLLIDFPFVDGPSHSVALSACMTPIARGACKVVPLHVIRAPTPGSGKSYLLDTATAISIGQPCPVLTAGRNEEETEKRLGAALLTGQSIISIDNHNGDLGGDALCQMIERPIVTVRILGKSEQAVIESRSTFFANGNNIRLTGDITRRAVQCTLDAQVERPEQRSFRLNPVQTVLDNRGEYIAAVLTIIRAYIVAGKPGVIRPPLGSFEEWSDLVRSSLVWLGKDDPLASMETARAEDPSLQAIAEVFTAIWEKTNGKEFKTKDLIEWALDRYFDGGEGGQHDYKNPELREALINAASDQKGFLHSKPVGRWLSRHKGRISNNLRLENRVDEHGHSATWWLVRSGPAV